MDTAQQEHRRLIDLLSLEHVFSQNRLLTGEKFREACERRGLSLLWININEQLEALHRADVLVPIYRVAKDTHTLRRAAHEQGLSLSAVLSLSSLLGERLHEAHADGRVFDPRDELFVPWRRFESLVDGSRIQKSEFAFSPYQLLLIPNMRYALSGMQWQRTRSGNRRAHLIVPEHTLNRLKEDRQHNDELILALSALDRIYRPDITHVISLPGVGSAGEQAWKTFEDSFDPASMLSWLGWKAERVQEEAEHLIHIASSLDPLDDWLPLIRLCRPEKWERLSGDALVAMDHRIAAEILLRFYEDLARIGAAPDLPEIPRFAPHPLNERLKSDRHDLDAVLMDFGLSPYPSLILFLEGETEMEIVPRVLHRLEMRWHRSFIEIHNAYGIRANVGRIANYMVPLAFGEEHSDFVELSRPATRILAVFDRENALSDDNKILTEKQKWVSELFKNIPAPYRTPAVLETLRNQIEVITWDEGSFEFAHFSDTELRTALLSLCEKQGVIDAKVELWQIENARTQRQGIQTYLSNKVKNCLSKPKLACELWPILEHKISESIKSGTLESIPIVQALRTALDQALTVHRSDVGVQIYRPEDRTAT